MSALYWAFGLLCIIEAALDLAVAGGAMKPAPRTPSRYLANAALMALMGWLLLRTV